MVMRRWPKATFGEPVMLIQVLNELPLVVRSVRDRLNAKTSRHIERHLKEDHASHSGRNRRKFDAPDLPSRTASLGQVLQRDCSRKESSAVARAGDSRRA